MKKNLFILAALLLPASLCAQSALQQLESMAGMSIHDIKVPDPGDPVPVDPDPEEEPKQSTHLKDYTPAQETTQPAQQTSQPKPNPLDEWQRKYEEQEKKRREAEWQREKEAEEEYWKNKEEKWKREKDTYNAFVKSRPRVQRVPVFSSIDERKVVLPEPVSPRDLRDFGNFKLADKDSTYKVDYIRASYHSWPNAYFLGKRLENGRVEWRIFVYTNIEYGAKMGYEECNYSSAFWLKFDYHNIKDVQFAGEGRVVLLKLYNGATVVLKPDGQLICGGRDISFPAISGDVLFIECDGKLYTSNMLRWSDPILKGDHFDYYGRTVIVTQHDAEGKPYYQMCTYGGRLYNYKKHEWQNYPNDPAYYDPTMSYDFVAPFSNDGDYYVIKPRGKKYYQIVAYSGYENLYQGKKKYKTLDDAHAGWPKEKAYFKEMFLYKPGKAAQSE